MPRSQKGALVPSVARTNDGAESSALAVAESAPVAAAGVELDVAAIAAVVVMGAADGVGFDAAVGGAVNKGDGKAVVATDRRECCIAWSTNFSCMCVAAVGIVSTSADSRSADSTFATAGGFAAGVAEGVAAAGGGIVDVDAAAAAAVLTVVAAAAATADVVAVATSAAAFAAAAAIGVEMEAACEKASLAAS